MTTWENPLIPRELLARIKASLRRVTPWDEDQINLVISHADRRGYWQGQLIELTGAEFELLGVVTVQQRSDCLA